jgi:hypothetical protein
MGASAAGRSSASGSELVTGTARCSGPNRRDATSAQTVTNVTTMMAAEARQECTFSILSAGDDREMLLPFSSGRPNWVESPASLELMEW